LSRLSKKAGVKATIILDRASGAILKTSGEIAQSRPRRPSAASNLPNQPGGSFSVDAKESQASEPSPAEELAGRVWNFVRGAGVLVQELDDEVSLPFSRTAADRRWVANELPLKDELKLLRLRTKKQELVIVPDPKYLMILVHDTPPA
jgi:dynein light chain roadblock-type